MCAIIFLNSKTVLEWITRNLLFFRSCITFQMINKPECFYCKAIIKRVEDSDGKEIRFKWQRSRTRPSWSNVGPASSYRHPETVLFSEQRLCPFNLLFFSSERWCLSVDHPLCVLGPSRYSWCGEALRPPSSCTFCKASVLKKNMS